MHEAGKDAARRTPRRSLRRRIDFLRRTAAFALAYLLLSTLPAYAHRCTGDCDASDTVTIGELITGVRIALEQIPVFACLSFDADGDRRVSIDELLVAVNNAFSFCGHGIPTATSALPPTATPETSPTETPRPPESATPLAPQAGP